ncbi:MAG: hypothetical protein IKU36_04150 [Bacteroidales bacterium]|nr:hypothetical protein [Bacteroidales bacterium]
MTPNEFEYIAKAIRTYYPKEKLLPNEEAMTLWYRQLSDIDYSVALLALDKWVSTNKWSPSIADIRELANEVKAGELPDWGEAWETVMKGVRLFGSYDPESAYDLMDDLTKTVTKRVGWEHICFAENIDNVRANFRMIYEAEAKKRKREAQVSPVTRNRIGTVQLKGIEEAIE